MDEGPSLKIMSEVPNATPTREVQADGTIRFAVGSPTGLRSSTWRIWSAKHTKNVYLAARSIAGLQKVSLHESQNWSHSFVSDERALLRCVDPGQAEGQHPLGSDRQDQFVECDRHSPVGGLVNR
jgi:hypothetical protein